MKPMKLVSYLINTAVVVTIWEISSYQATDNWEHLFLLVLLLVFLVFHVLWFWKG